MNKSKAFIDTTIIADILTKNGQEKIEAKAALAKYETTELPVYAIKEFKAGVLDSIKYLYNKLFETKSVGRTFIIINDNARQINKRATAIRVLGELVEKFEMLKPDERLKKQYGDIASDENIMFDSTKLDAKMLLFKAWHKRNKLTTSVVQPLTCYQETAPFEEKNGKLSVAPIVCKTDNCCLAGDLWNKRFKLTKLKKAIENLPSPLKDKNENKKRAKLLREIGSNPGRKISNSDCRSLGDAIFALYCPDDSDILTTNVKDHKPLAKALGKTAVSPKEII